MVEIPDEVVTVEFAEPALELAGVPRFGLPSIRRPRPPTRLRGRIADPSLRGAAIDALRAHHHWIGVTNPDRQLHVWGAELVLDNLGSDAARQSSAAFPGYGRGIGRHVASALAGLNETLVAHERQEVAHEIAEYFNLGAFGVQRPYLRIIDEPDVPIALAPMCARHERPDVRIVHNLFGSGGVPKPTRILLAGIVHVLSHILDQVIYLRSEHPTCPACQAPVDPWHGSLRLLKSTMLPEWAFRVVGATTRIFTVPLLRSLITTVQFAEHGVPANARILHVRYSSQGPGALFPTEFSSTMEVPRRTVPAELRLYPMPAKGEKRRRGSVALMVTWIDPTPDDHAWTALVSAFESFVANDYEGMIIPANIAVELPLKRLLGSLLSLVAKDDDVKGFLQNHATYAHQLRILLPLVFHLTQLGPIPVEVVQGLLGLNRRRNEIAHSGSASEGRGRKRRPIKIQRDEAGLLLASSFFGFRLVQITWQRLGLSANAGAA